MGRTTEDSTTTCNGLVSSASLSFDDGQCVVVQSVVSLRVVGDRSLKAQCVSPWLD